MGEELLWAVKNGDVTAIKQHVTKSGFDVNGTLMNGRNALHYAADYGQVAVVDLLLEQKANINTPDKFGITPLLAAIYEGHVEVVKLLLKKGADKSGTAPDGSTYAACAETEELKALLKYKNVLCKNRLCRSKKGTTEQYFNAMLRQMVLVVSLITLLPCAIYADPREQTEEGLDNIIELMETLLKEYSNQDKQLNRIHRKLSSLRYGYNFVKRDLSTLECSMSEVLGQSSNAAVCLEEHKEDTEAKISEIQTCIDETQCTLDTVKEFSHPCGHGQWRVAVLKNYSDPCTECPPMWNEIMDDPTCRRFCGRGSDDDTEGCDSATFTIEGEYQRICGRIRAYNRGDALAIASTPGLTVDDTYLSGLSLTHGSSPRQHIWSFAIGLTEDLSVPASSDYRCPCDFGTVSLPGFISSDFFCESSWSVPSNLVDLTILNLDDTLWDGKQCRDPSLCCDNPPFFVRTLDGPTSDDLEIRMCNRLSATLRQEADIGVEFIEIFVQ